jgi:predicted dehydrogenase
MLRVGIISANWGAVAHLPAWRAVPGIEVIGICTSRRETAEAAAARYGIPRAFWDAQDMIADPDVDILDCGTRPSIRHPMVLSALAKGKHVYNAIPFAADLDRAREMHQARKASRSVAVVDTYSQWLPAHRMAKQMLDEGFLGQPFGGACFFNLGLFNQPNPRFPYNWFAESGHGVSAMRNLGSHALHMIFFLFGEVEEVIADDRQLLSEWRFPDCSRIEAETNDFANMLLRLRNGMIMQLQVSWSATVGRGWHLEAFGSNGRLLLAAPSFPTSLDTTLYTGVLGSRVLEQVAIPDHFMNPPEISIRADVQPQAAHGMAISMHKMKEAIQGNGVAVPDFDQAWTVERVLDAARRSSEERRWVHLDESA